MQPDNHFLKFVADYGVVSFALIRRLGLFAGLKDLKAFLADMQAQGLLTQMQFDAFACFHLTEAGYQTIQVEKVPKFRLNKAQAFKICQTNLLRFGIVNELVEHERLQLDRWVSQSRFQAEPLSLKIQDAECKLHPAGLMILSNSDGKKRLYFIHHFSNIEHLSFELFAYHLYQKRNLHQKRFHQSPETEMRVLCLFPSERLFQKFRKRLERNPGQAMTLFLDASKAGETSPLSKEQWFNAFGDLHRVI